MNKLNKHFVLFLNKDENITLFFLSITIIIIIIYLNIPSGGMSILMTLKNYNNLLLVEQLYPLGGTIHLNIVTILDSINSVINLIQQLLKYEFIPTTILFDEGNVIQVSDPIIHVTVQDLYKIKNYYCGVNLHDDLNIAIDPSDFKGILSFKQVHSLYLSDTWYSYKNTEGLTVWKNLCQSWPNHGGLISIKSPFLDEILASLGR